MFRYLNPHLGAGTVSSRKERASTNRSKTAAACCASPDPGAQGCSTFCPSANCWIHLSQSAISLPPKGQIQGLNMSRMAVHSLETTATFKQTQIGNT